MTRDSTAGVHGILATHETAHRQNPSENPGSETRRGGPIHVGGMVAQSGQEPPNA